jgi:hypothetical protein
MVKPSFGSRLWCHIQAPLFASTARRVSCNVITSTRPSATTGVVPTSSWAS